MIITGTLCLGFFCNFPEPQPIDPRKTNPVHVNVFYWKKED